MTKVIGYLWLSVWDFMSVTFILVFLSPSRSSCPKSYNWRNKISHHLWDNLEADCPHELQIGESSSSKHLDCSLMGHSIKPPVLLIIPLQGYVIFISLFRKIFYHAMAAYDFHLWAVIETLPFLCIGSMKLNYWTAR